MVGIIPAEMITDAGHCSTLHIHELSWALLDFPPLDSPLPSFPGACLGRPGPFLGICVAIILAPSSFHSAHITPHTSHHAPHISHLAPSPYTLRLQPARQRLLCARKRLQQAKKKLQPARRKLWPASKKRQPTRQDSSQPGESPADFS